MQNLNAYFIDHMFWDFPKLLEAHAERNLVKLKQSKRFPHLSILHYSDEIIYSRATWTPFAKACRGVIIDRKNKKILAKPFSKFFNLGEKEAPSIKDLEKKSGYTVTEKLDGSMIIAYYDEETNKFYMSTKGDLDSEHGQYATPLFPPQLMDKKLITSHTLMFELICKKYQIVIPYDKKGYEEGLYLIGIRENTSEKLFSPKEVQAFAKEFGLRTYKTYDYPTLDSIVEGVKTLPFTEEGFVVRFDGDETMVKIKSPEYLRVHRFVSNLTSRNLLDIVIEGEEKNVLDNLYLVPEEYREDVRNAIEGYVKDAYIFRKECYDLFAKAPKGSRKEYALWVAHSTPTDYKKFLFNIFDNEPIELKDIYIHFRKTKR